MNPSQDYKQLLSEVIKKQIIILGPDITLVKARNVPGLVVADDGTVTDISGVPQEITQKLIDQFVQLSGEIVKKTMEPLLMMGSAASVTGGQASQVPSANSGQVGSGVQAPPVTPTAVTSAATASMPVTSPSGETTPTQISSQPMPQNTQTPIDNAKIT